MFERLWRFLHLSDFQNLHESSKTNSAQSTPLKPPAFPHLPSYDVSFLPRDDALILDLNAIKSLTRTPRINISLAERARLTPNDKFDPLTVANLWLQLLLLHSFNGNFIRYPFSHPGSRGHIENIMDYNNHVAGGSFQITKLTDKQCDGLREVARGAKPMLDGSVVDLYCLLPYTRGIAGMGDYQIFPNSSLIPSPFPLPTRLLPPFPGPDVEWKEFKEWSREEYIERGFDGSCPLMPPNWFKIMEGWDQESDRRGLGIIDVGSGTAFEVLQRNEEERKCIIDIEGQTGVAWQQQSDPDLEWEIVDPSPILESWTIKSGSEKPVTVFLRERIKKFLEGKWIAMPYQNVITEQEHTIRKVEMKRILRDFGWPDTFPLEINHYRDFLTRVKQIQEGDWAAVLNVTDIWDQFERMRGKWYNQGRGILEGDGNEAGLGRIRDERVEAIDDEIWRVVTYEKQAERARIHMEATGEATDQCFKDEHRMEDMQIGGFAFGPEDVMRRWEELRALDMGRV